MNLPQQSSPEAVMRELTALSESLLSLVAQPDIAQALSVDGQRREAAGRYAAAIRDRQRSAELLQAEQRLLALDRRIVDAALQQRAHVARQSSNARENRTAREAYRRTLGFDVVPPVKNTPGNPQ